MSIRIKRLNKKKAKSDLSLVKQVKTERKTKISQNLGKGNKATKDNICSEITIKDRNKSNTLKMLNKARKDMILTKQRGKTQL